MADYISREAAYNAIVNNYTVDDQLQDLCSIPAADVAEERHGHWIDEYNECRCPYCGEAWNYCDNDTERFDFCPHCGAKMDESEEAE